MEIEIAIPCENDFSEGRASVTADVNGALTEFVISTGGGVGCMKAFFVMSELYVGVTMCRFGDTVEVTLNKRENPGPVFAGGC